MKNFFPALVVLALFVLTVPSVQAGETVCDGNTCRIVNRPILHAGAVAVTAPITHPPSALRAAPSVAPVVTTSSTSSALPGNRLCYCSEGCFLQEAGSVQASFVPFVGS